MLTTLGNTVRARAAKVSGSGGTAAGGASRKIAATATKNTRQLGVVLSCPQIAPMAGRERPRHVPLPRRLLGGDCRILWLAGHRIAGAFRLAGDKIAAAFRLAGNEVAAALGLPGDEVAGALRTDIMGSTRRL